jgi:hypothetical protein
VNGASYVVRMIARKLSFHGGEDSSTKVDVGEDLVEVGLPAEIDSGRFFQETLDSEIREEDGKTISRDAHQLVLQFRQFPNINIH